MDYPRYPEYKPSGVEWLGEVPTHWGLKRLKFATACINDKQDVLPEGLEYVAMENIESWTGKHLAVENGLIPESQTNRFRQGDVLFGKLRPYLAKAWLADRDGVCSTELLVLRERDLEPAYLRYWTLMQSFVEIVDGSTYGSKMPRASWDFIGNVPALIPERNEQRAIAAFLDHETARIDALIAKKQQLIELLAEKRAALISQAVTKGLNSDALMKDSGVEWLGEIPAHWELKKFGHIARVVRGASPRPAGDPRYFNGDHVPWITVADITKDRNKYLYETESMLTQEGESYSRKIASVTLLLTNSGATLGVPKILKCEGCANDGVIAFLELNRKAKIDYLYFYLLSLTGNFRERTKQGAGQPNLNTDIVRSTWLPFPPSDEQSGIATWLDDRTEQLEALVETIATGINRLREHRAAIISNAVTGKIDVRGFAKQQEVA